MSRYEFLTSEHEIVVGWDNPLQTYFAQVWKLEPGQVERPAPNFYDGSYDEPVLWVGTAEGEVPTVEALCECLKPYAPALPKSIHDSLQQDLEGRHEPTPHQKRMGSLVGGAFAPGASANDPRPAASDQEAGLNFDRALAQARDRNEAEANHAAENHGPPRRHER